MSLRQRLSHHTQNPLPHPPEHALGHISQATLLLGMAVRCISGQWNGDRSDASTHAGLTHKASHVRSSMLFPLLFRVLRRHALKMAEP